MVAGADGSPAATAEDMEFDYAHGIYTGTVTVAKNVDPLVVHGVYTAIRLVLE